MASGSNGAALRRYLAALHPADSNTFVEIAHCWRRGKRKGPMHRGAKGGIFLPASDLETVAREIEQLGRDRETWIGVLPRRPDPNTGEIGGTTEFVCPGNVLWADIDLGDDPDGLERLRAFRPKPQLLVASGGGYHAYWLVSDRLGSQAIACANRRLAHVLGADQGATDAARILRPPGTHNFKYEPHRDVDLIECHTEKRRPAEEIVGDLPDPPGAKSRHERRCLTRERSNDPLQLIAPPIYFAELAGLEVPASGFVRCPLPDHDDPDPSCRVWSEASRGWYCFGCRRGGDIYELAGQLWRLPRRGQSFLEIKERLTKLLRPRDLRPPFVGIL
jgi:DNA primase RepB-like protein